MEVIPTSAATLLVVVLAVLPGVPGDKLYRLFLGSDWREETWQRVLRLLGFSVFGLALYTVFAPVLHAPLPRYISPRYVAMATQDLASLPSLFGALLGHFVASGAAGLGAASVARALGRWGSVTGFANTWDYFITKQVPSRWAVVRLANGDAYAGILDMADTSVGVEERDLVLREPALYEAGLENYVATPYQYLFLSGDMIASVGVLYDKHHDTRLTTPGHSAFPEVLAHEEEDDDNRTTTR